MNRRWKEKKGEVLLWSIAFPGFGQILNGQFFKGVLFIVLEIWVNLQGHFNEAIRLSFLGETKQALEVTNFQWLMFYPCLYLFSMWDAYREAERDEAGTPYLFLPFVFGAFFVTVGLMYSPIVTIFGIFPGPVFLPMLALIPGLMIGTLIRMTLLRYGKQST